MSMISATDNRQASGQSQLNASDTALIELVPAAVYICDADGVIQAFNRRAVELWGRAPTPGDTCERYCGAHALYTADGEALPHAKTPMAEALRTGRSFREMEVQIEQPEGGRVWVLVNIDPLLDDDGNVTGAINCFQDITAQKDAENRLKESEGLLRGIAETTPECIKVVSLDGSLVWMNPAGLRLIGVESFDEVDGADVFSFIAAEHRADWRRQHMRVCRGESLSWQFDIINRHGDRRHMESHATPLALPNGSTAHLAITRDITSRKQSERTLRDVERRSEDIMRALPVAIYTTDAEGLITSCNQAAADLAGRQPMLGVDRWCITHRLFHPDGRAMPHEECPMALTLRDGKPRYGEEIVAERPDGSRHPLLVYPAPLFNQSGETIGAVNMLFDISERKQAEQNNQRLAAIVASSEDAIISKDMSGIIQSWNVGAQRLFGYEEQEMIGKPINILIPQNRPDEEPNILRRIRAGERMEHYETVRRRKDGSLVDVSLTVSPLKDSQGNIVGASKIARNISDRKQHEQRQQLLINELNHRVKNTLATVQSIAAQTFREAAEKSALKWFEGRLISISRSHDVLTRENWEGADLRDIVDVAIAPASSDTVDRFHISGPDVRLMPRAALSLSLALHELCTNALKYGALSTPDGHVRLEWRHTSSALEISWTETGGPAVTAPERKGFGSRLLEQALSYELEADVDLGFPESGVVCIIRLPLQTAEPDFAGTTSE